MKHCRLLLVAAFVMTVSFLSLCTTFRINHDTDLPKPMGFKDRQADYDAPMFAEHPITISLLEDTERNAPADDYFTPGKNIMTNYDFDTVINSANVCQNLGKDIFPSMVFLVLSVWDHKEYRDAIRDTWAGRKFFHHDLLGLLLANHSVRTRSVGDSQTPREWSSVYRHVFLIAVPTGDNEEKAVESLKEENKKHKDIVLFGFRDSYFNLTLKVISGFQWAAKFCPKASHVVKVDEDTFVHLPRVYSRLLKPKWQTSIVGPLFFDERASREGKHAVSMESYPLPVYPAHVKGNIYWMPSNVSRAIARVASYMPYVNIEDVHVTGILAKVVSAHHLGLLQSDYSPLPAAPKTCDFQLTEKLAAQNVSPQLATSIWRTLENPSECPLKQKDP